MKAEGFGDVTLEPIDISPNKDNSILKAILRAGAGKTPRRGHIVFLDYTGKLIDGTVFASSNDKDPIQFALGKGDVIEAWDICVATMRRNEKCALLCTPEYGNVGKPPNVPPNCTVLFHITLMGWKEDVTPDEDGGIIKLLTQEGEGCGTPNDGAVVEVHLVGKYEESAFDNRNLEFYIGKPGNHEIIQGLNIAIKSMRKHEISIFEINPKYAFGDKGKPEHGIPSNAKVTYEVALKAFKNAREIPLNNGSEKSCFPETSESCVQATIPPCVRSGCNDKPHLVTQEYSSLPKQEKCNDEKPIRWQNMGVQTEILSDIPSVKVNKNSVFGKLSLLFGNCCCWVKSAKDSIQSVECCYNKEGNGQMKDVFATQKNLSRQKSLENSVSSVSSSRDDISAMVSKSQRKHGKSNESQNSVNECLSQNMKNIKEKYQLLDSQESNLYAKQDHKIQILAANAATRQRRCLTIRQERKAIDCHNRIIQLTVNDLQNM